MSLCLSVPPSGTCCNRLGWTSRTLNHWDCTVVTTLLSSSFFCFFFINKSSSRPYVTGHDPHVITTGRHQHCDGKLSATGRKWPSLCTQSTQSGCRCARIYRGTLFTTFPDIDPALEFYHIPSPRRGPLWPLQCGIHQKAHGSIMEGNVHWELWEAGLRPPPTLVHDKPSLQLLQSLMKYSSRDEAVTSIPSSHLYRSLRLLSFAFFSSISNGTHWDSSITYSTPVWRGGVEHRAHKCYHYPQYIAAATAIYHWYLCAATSVCAYV